MCIGAHSIDDVDVVRCGGMKTLFDGVVNACERALMIGTLLREFTFGHAQQLGSVLGAQLAEPVTTVALVPGAARQVFIDIDYTVRLWPAQCQPRRPV